MQTKKFVNLSVVFGLLIFSINCNPFAPENDSPVNKNILSKKDSIAVRHILDINGLDSIKVNDVINLYNSLVGAIYLNSMALKTFTFDRYLDSFYICPPSIYLRQNNIDSIIITDTIKGDFYIFLENNKLRTIPDDIGKFKGEMALYLESNQLTTISPQIMNCSFFYGFGINNNMLCNLPDSISQWVTKATFDSTWLSTQACR